MHIEMLADGLGFTEGPVRLADGRVALTSISHGCVYIVDPAGGAIERIDTGGGPNGLALGPGGELYVAQNGGVWGGSGPAEPGVQRIVDGRVDYLVEGLGAPNDLMFGPDGRLWITDTVGEFDLATPQDGPPGRVLAADVDTGETDVIVGRGPVFVNGLGFSADSRLLLVTATVSAQLLAYPLGPTGTSGGQHPSTVHTFQTGWPDGITVDARGIVWVALTQGDRIDAIDPTGRCVDTVRLPEGSLPTNLCWADERCDELFVTAAYRQALLRIRVR